MPLVEIDDATLERVTAAAVRLTEDEEEQTNHIWWALYGNEFGFHRNTADNLSTWEQGDGDSFTWDDANGKPIVVRDWAWRRRRMTRREWIERFVIIKDKTKKLVAMVLNAQQREMEAAVLRSERAGRPVRLWMLKVRQIGASTYVQGFGWESDLRNANFRALMVAHRKKTASAIFNKVHMMRRRMPRIGGGMWNFSLPHKSRSEVTLGDPIGSTLDIDSAEVEEPGHGETIDLLHMTETARWKNAEEKAKGLEQTVPEEPNTYVFSESTANGDAGYFRDTFWRNYAAPGSVEVAIKDEDDQDWQALFFPWFEFDTYRWSYSHKKPLPQRLRTLISESLDDIERRLLATRFFERGRGWRHVDIDQLAWRRETKRKKCSDSWQVFNEQYPGYPEDAFVSSGRVAFDVEKVKGMMRLCTPPMTVGDFVEQGTGPEELKAEVEWEANDGAPNQHAGFDTARA